MPILCYHQVRPWRGDDSEGVRTLVMEPENLTAHMKALKSAGYTSITPAQLLEHLEYGTELPAKPILITFDDASAGQWRAGGPIVEKFGFTATYFIMTVVLGNDTWMTKGDVADADRAGMTIGSHTWDHHPVTEYGKADWKLQLTGSIKTLEDITGKDVKTFAYPYGSWDEDAFGPLKANGIDIAFQLTDKPIDKKAPLYTQRRLLVNGYWDGKDLLAQIKDAFPNA